MITSAGDWRGRNFIIVPGRTASNADGADGRSDWLLAHPYARFGDVVGSGDRYFYSCYYCSQAALQLGGRYWEGIYPPLAEALLRVQSPDGSWPTEPNGFDGAFGNLYTTPLAVLALTPPYQLLPVYQR